jgi:hypothetical protein
MGTSSGTEKFCKLNETTEYYSLYATQCQRVVTAGSGAGNGRAALSAARRRRTRFVALPLPEMAPGMDNAVLGIQTSPWPHPTRRRPGATAPCFGPIAFKSGVDGGKSWE